MLGFRDKLKTVLFAIGLLLVALLLYSAYLRRQESSSLFERAVLRVTAPLQNGLDFAWDGLYGIWDHYLWLIETSHDNETLLAENRRLQGELTSLEELRLANQRLRRMLDFVEETELHGVAAEVIAEDATSWFRTVVIDKGSDDGLAEGMPVVVSEGVVGRVIRVAGHEARVLLITDASSAAAALVQRTRTRGISRGEGDALTLDFALRQADIRVGDKVITSGMGGVFPKGLAIGDVVEVEKGDFGLFQSVKVRPVADFSRLEEVLVLLGESS
ncbi:MAG: rod shape-determining protein MreC [Desulfuromonas sp.]|nr:MAG: rod shape-determining protein MreC [Desulfuromonas sp.]